MTVIKSIRQTIISEPAPIAGRVNEDALYIDCDGNTVLAAVIDGASERYRLPPIKTLLDRYGYATPAQYAAQLTRNAIIQRRQLPLREILLNANAQLRDEVESVLGKLTNDTIARLGSTIPQIKADPRLIRSVLPVCVVTVMRLDLNTAQLEIAHAGDTALVLFHHDGCIEQPTPDQMQQHDERALAIAERLYHELGAKHLREVIGHEQVQTQNAHNGLYHNFVDQHGQPDKRVGVGVIDGLPQIEHYIVEASLDVSTVDSILVCSDGFMLPAPLRESESQQLARLTTMREVLHTEGIYGYVKHLRAVEAQDHNYDVYPRFKTHDDATGIYLELLGVT